MGNHSTFSRHNNYTNGTTASSAGGWLELGRASEYYLERPGREENGGDDDDDEETDEEKNHQEEKFIHVILKTIGNRKGDCA